MKLKTKLAAFALAVTCSFGGCAHAATEVPKLLPFLNTDSAAVVAMIDSIQVADLTTEKQIEEAFIAYCDLEDSAKAEVTNYEKLHEMRNTIAKLYNPDAENKQGGTLIDRSQFLIGTYCVNKQSWNDEHFQAMKDCNIDIITNGAYNTEFLDLCEKYGIKTYVDYLPYRGYWASGGNPNSIDFLPSGSYNSYAEKFEDHPAIAGFHLCDEPHSLDFEQLEILRAEAQALFPNKLIYINLFPSGQKYSTYGHPDGSEDYLYYEYINDYEKTINTDFISFDQYSYAWSDKWEGGFYIMEALSILADKSRETDKEFWFIPQVSSSINDVWVTEQQLRYQVYTAMAFGVKAINWACWNAGWWHANNQVVDSQGNFTEQYEKLKTINHEIKSMSPVYMKYTNVDTVFSSVSSIPYTHEIDSRYKLYFDNDLDQNAITNIETSDNSTILTGYFEKNLGNGTAFMFANATDLYCGEDYVSKKFCYEPNDAKVYFKVSEENVELTAYHRDFAYKLSPDENGVYSLSIPNGEGIFVTIDPITAE